MHYRDAVFLQPSIAAFVVSRSVAHAVAYSVNLDREVCLRAIEIENVRTDWMLAAEHRLAC